MFKDGKATIYEVPESSGKAYHRWMRNRLHVAVKILGAPARWLRAGSVLTPEFAFKNPFRDQLAGFTQTKYGYIPVYDFGSMACRTCLRAAAGTLSYSSDGD